MNLLFFFFPFPVQPQQWLRGGTSSSPKRSPLLWLMNPVTVTRTRLMVMESSIFILFYSSWCLRSRVSPNSLETFEDPDLHSKWNPAGSGITWRHCWGGSLWSNPLFWSSCVISGAPVSRDTLPDQPEAARAWKAENADVFQGEAPLTLPDGCFPIDLVVLSYWDNICGPRIDRVCPHPLLPGLFPVSCAEIDAKMWWIL